jgi:hypothetical protein
MSCEFSGNELDGCHGLPGGCVFSGVLEVLGEAWVSVEANEGPLDDPASLQEFEARGGIGSPDDFECPFADLVERRAQFFASITAIGKDVAQLWEAVHVPGHNQRRKRGRDPVLLMPA